MRERDYLPERDDDIGVTFLRRTEPVESIDDLLLLEVNRRIIAELGEDYVVNNPVRVNIYLDGYSEYSIRYAIEHINIDPQTGEKNESGIIGYVYTSDPYDPAHMKIYEMTPKKMLIENIKYTKKFPFISKDIFLVATVDPKRKSQQLIFQKKDPSSNLDEVFAVLSCIQTLIVKGPDTDISDENKPKSKKPARDVLNLSELFFAFKSWVQVISELGMGAFDVIEDIERNHCNYLDITDFLFENMMLADHTFLNRYLNRIKRESKLGSGYDSTMIRQKMEIILRTINRVDFFDEYSGYCEVYTQVDHGFPLIPMTDDLYEDVIECLGKIAKIDAQYLFDYQDQDFFEPDRIQRFIASESQFSDMPEFKAIFSTKRTWLKESLIDNVDARKFPEWVALYKAAFTDSNIGLREKVASCPLLIDDPEVKELFRALFKDKGWGVRASLAGNPSAVNFPEYNLLFDDPHYLVRRSIVANYAARKYSEYNDLIPITDETPYNHHWYKKTHYPEYKRLFSDEYEQVRLQLAYSNIAVEFPEFIKLFSDSSDQVRYSAAENYLAPKLPEYQKLLNDPCQRVRESAKKHWEENDLVRINGMSINEFHED